MARWDVEEVALLHHALGAVVHPDGRALLGQRPDEDGLEDRRHQLDELGRAHRRHRPDLHDVTGERDADDLRADEHGAGVGPVGRDRRREPVGVTAHRLAHEVGGVRV